MRTVVIGMHRSGTSIVANILNQLGVNMGDHVLGADVSNVDGHFEDIEFYQINNKIFEKMGASWSAPPTLEKVMEFEQQIKSSYTEIFNSKSENWGFKEPKSTILLPAVLDDMRDFFLIYCVRDAAEVGHSLSVRDGMDTEEATSLKEHYDSFAQYSYANHKGKKILVRYEDLIKSPQNTVEVIAENLGVKDVVHITNAIGLIKSKEGLREKKINLLIGEVKEKLKRSLKEPKKVFSRNAIEMSKRWWRLVVDIIR